MNKYLKNSKLMPTHLAKEIMMRIHIEEKKELEMNQKKSLVV